MDQRFAVKGVEATTPLARAAPALLLAKAEPLFALEESARGGTDMDAVHDMRVASRRMREAMRILQPLYASQEYDAWWKRVRRVTRALGPVRDADVFVAEFSGFAKKLGEGGRRAVAFLVGHRMGVREHDLHILERRLNKLDLRQNRGSFRRLAFSLRRSARGEKPLAEFAHAAVAERAAVVFGALPDALVEENVLQQHALRIDFKRLRYAVELFAPVYADAFDDVHTTLTAFQDALGDMHDLHVFADSLREPSRLEAAARAGVSADDMAEVVALLETRAADKYRAFRKLVDAHPAAEFLGELLLPLVPKPAAPEVPNETAPAEQAADGGDSHEEAEAAAATDAPAAAVVLKPAAPVVDDRVPQLDPTRPWRSDAAGLAIDPPIVIGAEPWARPQVDVPGGPGATGGEGSADSEQDSPPKAMAAVVAAEPSGTGEAVARQVGGDGEGA